MKKERIFIRVSDEDKKQIQRATKKYHKETGAKENASAAIRHIVGKYIDEQSK